MIIPTSTDYGILLPQALPAFNSFFITNPKEEPSIIRSFRKTYSPLDLFPSRLIPVLLTLLPSCGFLPLLRNRDFKFSEVRPLLQKPNLYSNNLASYRPTDFPSFIKYWNA